MDDYSKALTMGFGLMLGLTSGAFVSEHRAAWEAVTTGSCELGAIESGRTVEDECPRFETFSAPATVAFLPLDGP